MGDTPEEKFLRAIDIQTGKITWEIPKVGGSGIASGLMSTAGGIVFYGDGSAQSLQQMQTTATCSGTSTPARCSREAR